MLVAISFLHCITMSICGIGARIERGRWVRALVGSISYQDYTIGICFFSAKHATFRDKEQRVVGWELRCVWVKRYVYQLDCCFSELALYKTIQLSVLVLYKADIIIIASNVVCSHHDIDGQMLFRP